MFDLIIRNGSIIDGTGKPACTGDVAIRDGRIREVGVLPEDATATEEIDAAGRVVCPGFIDVHSHSDHTLMAGPEAESKVLQGVTTEVVGNCGFSGAPLSDHNREQRKASIKCYHLEPTWSSFGDFLDKLDSAKPGLNVVALIGHGTLRSAVLGYEDRQPDAAEQQRMEDLLDEALDAGAYGFSTGLAYAPGMFASEDELTRLSSRVAKRDGVCTSHMRSESDRLIEALDEFLRIGRQSGSRLQVSHLKAAGQHNWGKVGQAIERIEQYHADGLPVAFDRYPYTAASSSLDIFVPKWAHDGGNERLLERLRDPDEGPRVRDETAAAVVHHCGWDNIRVTSMELDEPHAAEGKSVAAYAEEVGGDPAELAVELLLESRGRVGCVFFSMHEDDVRQVMAHDWCMIGSDAAVRCTKGILSQGVPHPRAYGTYPRYLGEYVREHRLVSLEEAIRRLTSFSADHFRMRDRGRIEAGYAADVVVFDPATIRDTASFERPHQNAVGIDAVLVNGKVAARGGELTGTRGGEVLRFG